MTGFVIVIPARFESSRLPGKPLMDLCGKSLIRRVYECSSASSADKVIVATDDKRIYEEVLSFDGDVEMTSTTHLSGSDRIAEVAKKRNFSSEQVIVNVQGDEPFLPVSLIDSVADALLNSPGSGMATACYPILNEQEFNDPNVVKVVRDAANFAMYFSRHPIPYCRDGSRKLTMMRHVGLYAYRAGFLARFTRMSPCLLEQDEQLEQLRALYNGERITVSEIAEMPGPGIDTGEDLDAARAYLSRA